MTNDALGKRVQRYPLLLFATHLAASTETACVGTCRNVPTEASRCDAGRFLKPQMEEVSED